MAKGKVVSAAFRKITKAQLTEILERQFAKQGGKREITREMASEVFNAGDPFIQKPPSSLLTLKPPKAARGDVPDLGLEQAFRVEKGMAEEAYAQSKELFSPRRYGVRASTPTKRLRFATDEDPAENVVKGMVYEEEASLPVNVQGQAKKKLMATPLAEIAGNAERANWLWNSMAVKEIGKARDKSFGRTVWKRYHTHDKSKYKPESPKAYFQANFMAWMKDKGAYAKAHPDKALLLEMVWDAFKPSGA